jgi:hypothetical protein
MYKTEATKVFTQIYSGRKILLLVSLLLYPVLFFILFKVVSLSSSLIERIELSQGGRFAIVIFFVSFLFYFIWIMLVIKRKLLYALGLQILMLPMTFYSQNIYAIVAYSFEGFVQKISLTTFLIFSFLIIILIMKKLPPRAPSQLNFEICLWIFALLSTFSQLINFPFVNAILLSLGGVWQFVALYYILRALIKKYKDVQFLIKCIILSVLIGIVVRIGYTGKGFLVKSTIDLVKSSPHVVAGEFTRIGGAAFGYAQSYGGYLSFVALLSLFFIQSNKSIYKRLAWGSVIVIFLFEMINTFTRGAVFEMFFALLLLFWKDTRRFSLKLFAIFGVLFSFSSNWLLGLIQIRGFGLSLNYFLNNPNVMSRINFGIAAIPHFFDKIGLGYGIGNPLIFYSPLFGERGAENLILHLSQSVGGIATIFFIILFFSSIRRLYKISVRSSSSEKKRMAIYLLIALLGWFFFANTTSTSIVCYHPYEATILFYLVMFMAVILPSVEKKDPSYLSK